MQPIQNATSTLANNNTIQPCDGPIKCLTRLQTYQFVLVVLGAFVALYLITSILGYACTPAEGKRKMREDGERVNEARRRKRRRGRGDVEAGTGTATATADATDIDLERPTAVHVEGGDGDGDGLPRYEEVETLREKVVRPAAARLERSGVGDGGQDVERFGTERRGRRDARIAWDFGGN